MLAFVMPRVRLLEVPSAVMPKGVEHRWRRASVRREVGDAVPSAVMPKGVEHLNTGRAMTSPMLRAVSRDAERR